MRILLLSQFFWPEARTAPTNLAALAEDLSSRGHEVLVVTGVPNHPIGQVYDGYRMRPWQWQTARGFKILRLPLYPDHSRSIVRRGLNYLSFLVASATLGPLLTSRFKADVLLVYYAPITMGLVGAVFKLFRRVPMIYWITDIWPENLRSERPGMSDANFRRLRKLEDWSYRRADTICIDSPGFLDSLLEKGVPQEKIRVVSEWADESLFHPTERDDELGERWGLAGKFNVIYAGSLGPMQHLDTALDAAHLLRDLEDVQLVLIGGGNDKARLEKRARDLGLTNVRFIAHQPIDEVHRFLVWADALLVHLKRLPIFSRQLPSKLLAYMACGRPILAAVPGTVESIVSRAQAGVCSPSEDPEAMAAAVRTLHALTPDERARMGENGRSAYLERHSRASQVTLLEGVVRATIDAASDSRGADAESSGAA